MINKVLSSLLTTAAILWAGMGAALADAIDGTWCHEDGRTMSIDGSNITVPGGQTLSGNYRRHSFSYTAPEGSAEAGGVVSMVLVDENTVHLTPPASISVTLSSSVQTWRRCEMTS